MRGALALAVAAIGAVPVSAQAFTSGLLNSAMVDLISVVAPASGNTISMDGLGTLLVVNSGQILATLNVTLPSNPVDGQRVIIATTNAITILSVSGGTVKGGITTLAANGWARFAFSASVGGWVRTG